MVKINNILLGVFVNSCVVQWNVEIKWFYLSWNFVVIMWNKIEGKVGVLLNCSFVLYQKDIVDCDFFFVFVLLYYMFMFGVNNV